MSLASDRLKAKRRVRIFMYFLKDCGCYTKFMRYYNHPDIGVGYRAECGMFAKCNIGMLKLWDLKNLHVILKRYLLSGDTDIFFMAIKWSETDEGYDYWWDMARRFNMFIKVHGR